MPHTKKPKLTHDANTMAAVVPSQLLDASMINELSADDLAMIFGCLCPVDILRLRRVCTKWSEAAKKTIVPLTEFEVHDVKSYNVMVAMTTALPNLQQLELGSLGYDFSNDITHRYVQGEDPSNSNHAQGSDNDSWHDINMISSFTKLRILKLSSSSLNGKYPYLFNFPLLQKLNVDGCRHFKWDLTMLAGLPLKELHVTHNQSLTGNISSLRMLKDTLEKVGIVACEQVGGNFLDLADFPHLKSLDLFRSDSITGDIRNIGENVFPKLERLSLPESVYGGNRYEVMRISDAKALIATIYKIKKQPDRHPSLFENFNWYLSESSPDWYQEEFAYPFSFCIVRAGSRLGWRWERKFGYTPDYSFEVNWLDPLPAKGSSEYASYIKALQEIESVMDSYPFFRGYHEPPTEAVFNRLSRQYRPSREEMEIVDNL